MILGTCYIYLAVDLDDPRYLLHLSSCGFR